MTTTPQITTYVLAGTEFDLTRTWVDVYRARWTWTGSWQLTMHPDGAVADEPLMQRKDDPPMVLSLVYWTYGPLIPAPRRVTSAEVRAAITACPSPAPAQDDARPTPRTFALVLQRLRPRRRSA